MEPLIIASSFWGCGRPHGKAGWPIKQRSPAGGRWADREIHQIEKMRHFESLIVGVDAASVKLDEAFLSSLEELD
jgi:hypothetical protein